MPSRSRVCLALLVACIAGPCAATSAQVFDVLHAKGFLEGSFYPPHNEFDPNPGIPFAQRPTARYGLRTDLELNLVRLPRFLVWADLRFYFGDSRPQTDYNYNAKGLAANLAGGFGYRLTTSPDLQIRYATGRWFDLGGLVYADRLPWSAVQVRWSFDTR